MRTIKGNGRGVSAACKRHAAIDDATISRGGRRRPSRDDAAMIWPRAAATIWSNVERGAAAGPGEAGGCRGRRRAHARRKERRRRPDGRVRTLKPSWHEIVAGQIVAAPKFGQASSHRAKWQPSAARTATNATSSPPPIRSPHRRRRWSCRPSCACVRLASAAFASPRCVPLPRPKLNLQRLHRRSTVAAPSQHRRSLHRRVLLRPCLRPCLHAAQMRRKIQPAETPRRCRRAVALLLFGSAVRSAAA